MAAVFLAGCAAKGDVETFHDPATSFDELRTWAFLPSRPPDAITNRPTLVRVIETAIREQMTANGFRLVPLGPDFLVNYHVVGGDVDVRTTWDLYGRADLFLIDAVRDSRSSVYVDGTMIVDVLDPENRSVLWRGVVSKAIPAGSGTARQGLEAVERGVAQVVGQFPP
jgi:hypothetical protein